MTCAVGMCVPGGVILAADKRSVVSDTIVETYKLAKSGQYWFVVSGYSVARDVLAEALDRPDAMNSPLRPHLAELFEKYGWNPFMPDGGPASIEMSALVTDGKTLWRMGGDFHAVPVRDFAAIGSGGDFALGALAMKAGPSEAVRVAARYDTHTGNGVDEVFVQCP